MIDQRILRENPKLIEKGLKSRGMNIDLAPLQKFCKELKELEEKRNNLQAQGNSIGKEVGQKIQKGLSPNSEEISNLRDKGNQIKKQVGDIGIGGDNPVRVQSMINEDTMDIEGSVTGG